MGHAERKKVEKLLQVFDFRDAQRNTELRGNNGFELVGEACSVSVLLVLFLGVQIDELSDGEVSFQIINCEL